MILIVHDSDTDPAPGGDSAEATNKNKERADDPGSDVHGILPVGRPTPAASLAVHDGADTSQATAR